MSATDTSSLPSGNIFLVGPMGVGKTTIGRQLAKQLHKAFVDSDHEIENHTGANIPLIFDLEGEEGFRTRERKMINKLTQRENIVLATGGGAVLDKDNRANMSARGFTIYLHATVDELLKRTRRDRNRPLLQTQNPEQKLEQLMQQRDPLYREVANIVIETGRRKIKDVVREIMQQLPT